MQIDPHPGGERGRIHSHRIHRQLFAQIHLSTEAVFVFIGELRHQKGQPVILPVDRDRPAGPLRMLGEIDQRIR